MAELDMIGRNDLHFQAEFAPNFFKAVADADLTGFQGE